MYYSPQRIYKGISWFFFGTPSQKRRVRLECAQTVASFFGDFPFGDDHKLWLQDKEFRKKFKELSPISPYSLERKWMLREFARYVRDLPGNMAECGCYQGASAYFMARENPDTPLHLFDSFEGLSSPGQNDSPKKNDSRSWKQGDMSSPEDIARKTLKKFDNIFFHKGWIPSKFYRVKDEQFKLVHIDVDLYQPTKDCLDFFYPRMVSKGVIILDDYGSTLCPGAYKAVEEIAANRNIYVIHLSTMQGLIIKD